MASVNSLLRSLAPPLHPRDPQEHHRTATSLELLFDLVSVIAIASAAAGLHHAISEAHAIEGLLSFGMAFFAIWWAWMNFTWFASAYDNDDTTYRLLTMVIMGGALVVAAGIPNIFAEQPDFTMVIIGYVVMRMAMVVLWLRAGCADSAHRRTALAYAIGITLVQVYWVIFLLVQPLSGPLGYAMWLVGFLLELSVPAIAEPLTQTTPWHRHHIVERYGLLVIIVLGETLLSGSLALRQSAEAFNIMLVHTALSALVIVFALWWIYFSPDPHLHDRNLRRALIWGYGHFVIFASGAAIGAGFGVLVDVITGHAKVSILVGDYAVAFPVAGFLLGLWFVRDRYVSRGASRFVLPASAFLALIAPVAGLGLEGVAATTVLAAVLRAWAKSPGSVADHGST